MHRASTSFSSLATRSFSFTLPHPKPRPLHATRTGTALTMRSSSARRALRMFALRCAGRAFNPRFQFASHLFLLLFLILFEPLQTHVQILQLEGIRSVV